MSDFDFPLPGPSPVPTPTIGPTGWPNRTTRDAWPVMVDEVPAVRPDQYLDAQVVNLWWWQLAGMGVLAPQGVLYNDPFTVEGDPPRLRWAAFTWHQDVFVDVIYANSPSFLTIVKNGSGDFTYTFANTATGRDGSAQTLALQGAFAGPCGTPDNVPTNVRAEVTRTANAVRVRTRTHLGVLADSAHVLVVF